MVRVIVLFFQAEDGIRDLVRSRGLGDVYKRQQLYYPYRQWSEHTNKKVFLLFFEKRVDEYLIWQYEFKKKDSYDLSLIHI